MKIPRNLSGKELIKILGKFGYQTSRQKGSHVRLTLNSGNESFHVTIPLHNPIKIGTLLGILNDVSIHLNIPKEEILNTK